MLLSNPDGIANLANIRDHAPTLAAAATATKFKENPENSNYAAAGAATAVDSNDGLL